MTKMALVSWLSGRITGMKTYNTSDVALIYEWADRFFEVSTLIKNLFCACSIDNPLPILSFDNEIEYQRLRFWFCRNHQRFVSIWADFCNSTGELTEFGGNFERMDYIENPFLFYYYPDNLLDLVYSIGAMGDIDNPDLDKEIIQIILNVNNRFSHKILHLKHWIGEFAEISGECH